MQNDWRAGASQPQLLQRQQLYNIIYLSSTFRLRMSGHTYRAHVVITGCTVCSCKDHSRMATNETPEQREARLVRRREQYRQRHAVETADAREARLERQRESARRRCAMESVSDRNARLSQARRHQWKRVSTETSRERETRLQRLRAAQQLRLAAESRVAPARQTMIYIHLVILTF